MAETGGWCTIESDPGVFTELLETIGVRGIQVEELYALDKPLIQALQPVYGLIFLFKYRPTEQSFHSSRPGTLETTPSPKLFFARQVIQNACATQALLSIILNTPNITIGDELSNLKGFTEEFDYVTRGEVLSNSEVIRSAHNSFAPQQAFVVEDPEREKETEDVYHFIAYLPIGNKVYELDGLQGGPRVLGELDSKGNMKNEQMMEEEEEDEEEKDWLDIVIPVIQKRIAEYSTTEIRFNLMAVIEERKPILEKLLNEMEISLQAIDKDKDKDEYMRIVREMNDVRNEVSVEMEKRERWRRENLRRKHSFIPFMMNLLKVLAEKKQLEPIVEKVKNVRREKFNEEAQKKEKAASSTNQS